MPAIYLDSSAIVKLAVAEPQSEALREFLRGERPLVSSALARTEVTRALRFEGTAGIARGRAVLLRLDLIRINDRVLDMAGAFEPDELRPLDALHLATATLLGSDLGLVVTYDRRMQGAAQHAGLATAAPT